MSGYNVSLRFSVTFGSPSPADDLNLFAIWHLNHIQWDQHNLAGAAMTDVREQIDQLIKDAERKAFKLGWEAACNMLMTAVTRMPALADEELCELAVQRMASAPNAEAQLRRGRPAGRAVDIVADCIASNPGMKGVEVVKAAQEVDPTIKERTVRTHLRRLRLAKVIWRRTGQWYPKSHDKAEAEHGMGEALGPPPL